MSHIAKRRDSRVALAIDIRWCAQKCVREGTMSSREADARCAAAEQEAGSREIDPQGRLVAQAANSEISRVNRRFETLVERLRLAHYPDEHIRSIYDGSYGE